MPQEHDSERVLGSPLSGAAQQTGIGAWVLATFAAGAVGSVFTAQSVSTWYAALAKPDWTPPGWLFSPVWITLYAMMALAAWLVWRQGGFRPAAGALALYLVQLGLNATWSGLFFGLRSPGLAFAELILLWVAIGLTAVAFWRHSRWAALLLVPYLVWTTFAGALNLAVWRMNA